MLTFLVVIGVLGVLFAMFVLPMLQDAEDARRAQEWADKDRKANSLATIEGFDPGLSYIGVTGGYGLALDPTSNRFAVAIPDAPPRVYRFDQLIAAEIARDGQTITTTKGKVDTSGAALGTLLVGPVGGLLAGAKTTSTSESRTFTTKLSLKLYVNDLHLPVIEIGFLGSGFGWQDGSVRFENAVNELDAWFGRFRTIIVGLERQGSAAAPTFAFEQTAPLPAAEQKGWMARTFGT